MRLSILIFVLFAYLGVQAAVLPPMERLNRDRQGRLLVWVYFKDKGPLNGKMYKKASIQLAPRAMERRLKNRRGAAVTFGDLPLYPPYVEQVKRTGARVRVASKWLNALSVAIDPRNYPKLGKITAVQRVEPLHRYFRPQPREEKTPQSRSMTKKSADSLDYGDSFTQLNQIQVPFMHKLGYTGEGVIIGMLDDGFNLWDTHETFDSLRVVATHDFVQGDDDVTDSDAQETIGTHGTKTLSTIAGYTPGELIGPAFKASYILARTEVDSSETQIEEDYWVAGLEWEESLGADIVSSSLGYIDWYTWEDMDGETAVTTRAADSAAARGVLVFNSAGNEGDNSNHNTLIAPADGKKVLAIAAVTSDGYRSSFSSVGPSADGRIKPDLAAMGSSVRVASSYDSLGYTYSSGTSFSCPLAAGAVALLLQAYPNATSEEIIAALKETATQHAAPDRYLGWGIIQLQEAYYYLQSLQVVEEETLPQNFTLKVKISPQPVRNTARVSFAVRFNASVQIALYNMLGQRVWQHRVPLVPAGQTITVPLQIPFLASGMYVYRITARELINGKLASASGKVVIIR